MKTGWGGSATLCMQSLALKPMEFRTYHEVDSEITGNDQSSFLLEEGRWGETLGRFLEWLGRK